MSLPAYCFSRQARRCLDIVLVIGFLFLFSYLLLEHRVDDPNQTGFQGNEKVVLDIISDKKRSTEQGEKCPGFDGGPISTAPTLGLGKSRYDNKRILRIYDFHYTGNEWDSLVDQYDVCFAAQTSIERIYWLPYVLEKWTGPLSLSVHLLSDEEWIILNLYKCYLSKCHSGYRNQVSMHLAVPSEVSHPFKIDKAVVSQWKIGDFEEIYKKGDSCPEAKEYLQYLLDTFPTEDKDKLRLKEVYPQNHMRNIARKACGIHWTYSADIDIIPRNGMAEMLQEFYENRKQVPCEKCAFVIPTFEMNESYPFPERKQDVADLVKAGAARQFHGKYYSPAHKATDYKRWVSTNLEEGPVTISHEILAHETFLYEPFYISADDIPPFDERFLGYGFTRNSQFKASYVAGWNFSVLTPVYSIHWGLQSSKTVISPKKDGVGPDVRRQQTFNNSKLYKKISEELQLKKRLGIF